MFSYPPAARILTCLHGQAGPLFIHPVFYHLPKLFYDHWLCSTSSCKSESLCASSHPQRPLLCGYVCTFVMLHFVKRELEALLSPLTLSPSDHRFSHGTTPFHNVFKKKRLIAQTPTQLGAFRSAPVSMLKPRALNVASRGQFPCGLLDRKPSNSRAYNMPPSDNVQNSAPNELQN
ncbi:hypothetical protein FIBSPDRAFT_938669 [Athelia psychrophila]|uniref:Uncharacterized protein n=1 Tax=Athelia psychrophila TaxID=1759441 RepID=A0A165XYS5_9AGAM|nr:hypothetical protein FIBSPDRAFT_938669 [Fibularhizoctonia sp. CBS 109695]